MEKKDTSEIVLKRHGSISPQPVCEERRSGMMKVDINTKMITLLGLPLTQSFAARMQNKGYEAAGLNMVYFYTETDNEHLGDIVNGLRYMNFAGFAVTKPNKVKVLEYLDELDPLCQKMGSSNTVVKTPEGKLIGYNTDGVGFYTLQIHMNRQNSSAQVRDVSQGTFRTMTWIMVTQAMIIKRIIIKVSSRCSSNHLIRRIQHASFAVFSYYFFSARMARSSSRIASTGAFFPVHSSIWAAPW